MSDMGYKRKMAMCKRLYISSPDLAVTVGSIALQAVYTEQRREKGWRLMMRLLVLAHTRSAGGGNSCLASWCR